MAYDASTLTDFKADPTDATSALNWLRFILRDTSTNEPTHTDAEYTALLSKDLITISAITFYRPHVTASAYLASDWTRGESESNRNGSIDWRDAKSLAESVFNSYSWMDDAIDAYLLANDSTETVASSLASTRNQLQLVI